MQQSPNVNLIRARCLPWAVLVGLSLPALLPVCSHGVTPNDSFKRPWESRPYKVLVWICSLDSPEISAVIPELSSALMQRAELADPSAWRVTVEQAPGPWRARLLAFINQGTPIDDLATAEILAGFDKLIAVCLSNHNGQIRYRVREFDVQTGQWGALLDRECPQVRDLPPMLFSAIRRVFMPLARIDRVSDAGEVFVRARAINACVESDILDGTVSPIEESPVWIRPEDRFLPIVRKVDRDGNLATLEPIPFTFLTIDSLEGSRAICRAHSRQNVPLGGRSSKRAQKLALVIRPPESGTKLKLVSRQDLDRPLSGYEIYSRPPQLPVAESRSGTKPPPREQSEFIGLTDWRGIVEIPPAEDGLRLIYVKRGARSLMKLPIIPGLYDQVVTRVPDDEARLNAEGIAQGFQIEILNLVAQRELYQAQIKSSLKRGDIETAKQTLQQLQRLESPQDLKIRMANEESNLRNTTSNQRELDRISETFQQLRTLINSSMKGDIESELQALIQRASGANRNNP